MIVATGTYDETTELVLLGLSNANLKQLKRGKPISKNLKFAGLPYHLIIVFGEDEMEIHRQLRVAGAVTKDTDVKGTTELEEDP